MVEANKPLPNFLRYFTVYSTRLITLRFCILIFSQQPQILFSMYDYPLQLRCSICGACFCVPGHELLQSYNASKSPYKPITQDQTLWLNRFYILGRYPERAQPRSLPQGQQDEIEDMHKGCFMSGIGRIRGSDIEFCRGGIVGSPLNIEYTSDGGEGEVELLTISVTDLDDSFSNRQSRSTLLFVHRDCHDMMLPRTIGYYRNTDDRWRDARNQLSVMTPDTVHTCLSDRSQAVNERLCDEAYYPPIRTRDSEIKYLNDWVRRRRVRSSFNIWEFCQC